MYSLKNYVLAGFVFVCGVMADGAAPASIDAARPLVIAHRGASGYLPEHTLEGYALAYGLGADYIEPDLVLTRDGELIAMHDLTLEATTDVAARFPGRDREPGRFYALDFTLAEIRTLTVRERVAANGERVFPARWPAGASAFAPRVPTFAEVVDLVAGLNASSGRTVGIYPEMKSPAWHRAEGRDIGAALLAAWRARPAAAHDLPIRVQSFEPESLRRWRSADAETPLVQLVGDKPEDDALLTAAGLADIAAYAQGVGPSLKRLFSVEGDATAGRALVEAARTRGLEVHVWTVRADRLPAHAKDLPKLVERLQAEVGVAGIFTDHADQVRRALR